MFSDHPNAVLDPFGAQNVRFAIPFIAYCTATGSSGFSVLINDKPGPVLMRHTLATVIHDIREIRSLVPHAARVVNHQSTSNSLFK